MRTVMKYITIHIKSNIFPLELLDALICDCRNYIQVGLAFKAKPDSVPGARVKSLIESVCHPVFCCAGPADGGVFWQNESMKKTLIPCAIEVDAVGGLQITWNTIQKSHQFFRFASYETNTANTLINHSNRRFWKLLTVPVTSLTLNHLCGEFLKAKNVTFYSACIVRSTRDMIWYY